MEVDGEEGEAGEEGRGSSARRPWLSITRGVMCLPSTSTRRVRVYLHTNEKVRRMWKAAGGKLGSEVGEGKRGAEHEREVGKTGKCATHMK